MRIRFSLIALTLIIGVLVSSCKKDPPVTKTDEEIQIEKLTGTWVLDTSEAKPVTVDNNDPPQDWTGFTLTLGDKTYNANTGASLGSVEVWPSGSGTWAFGTGVTSIVRDDGIVISVSVTDTTLELQFDYLPGGRVTGIEGNWIFKMVPN